MTDYQIPYSTTYVQFTFKPVYNGTPTKIEWVFEGVFDWGEGCDAFSDSAVTFQIYDDNGSSWSEIGQEHFLFTTMGNSNNHIYVGQLNLSNFYWYDETNPSYYIDDNGYVKTRITFNQVSSNYESELNYSCSGTGNAYTMRTATLKTNYNVIVVT